jgi:translation initiation factor 1 (eIF-1/SUI1)
MAVPQYKTNKMVTIIMFGAPFQSDQQRMTKKLATHVSEEHIMGGTFL